jgi:hypothetical protein
VICIEGEVSFWNLWRIYILSFWNSPSKLQACTVTMKSVP